MRGRKTAYIIVAACAALAAAFLLVMRDSGSSSVASDEVQSPLPQVVTPEETFNAMNSVRGHDERKVIAGMFDGKVFDTLRISAAAETEYVGDNLYVILDGKRFKSEGGMDEEWRFLWDIVSDKGSVPSLRVFGVEPLMVYEGDLDHNGSDEFGVLFTWWTSACRTYEVYTFHEGQWRCLIPQVRTAESLRASGLELVNPGDRPGEVKVTMSDFEAEGSCCTHAPDKDTVMRPTFEPVWNCWEK